MTLAQLVNCLHWTWCSFSREKSMQSLKKWLLHGWGNAGRNCSWGTCKHKPNYTTSTSLLMLAFQVAKITVCFPVGINRTKWYCVLSLLGFFQRCDSDNKQLHQRGCSKPIHHRSNSGLPFFFFSMPAFHVLFEGAAVPSPVNFSSFVIVRARCLWRVWRLQCLDCKMIKQLQHGNKFSIW